MSINFHCSCGQRLQVPDEMAGRTGKCPSCGAAVLVPGAPAAPAAPPPPAPPPPVVQSPPAAGAGAAPPVPPAPPAVVPPAAESGTKSCPHCGGVILANARKCKHCGEYLTLTAREQRMAGPGAAAPRGVVTPPPSSTDGMAIAALVLGIISLISWCCAPVGGITSLLALIFGFIGRGNVKRDGTQGDGFALAGIIMGGIGVFLTLAYFALQLFIQFGGGPKFR